MRWTSSPLKHWLDLNDGGVWGDDPTGVDDTSVVRSTDINLDGTWCLDDVAVRKIPPMEIKAKRLQAGDLVVVKSSGSVDHLGKTALVTDQVQRLGACFSNFVQRLRPSSRAEPRFVWYLLNSRRASSEMEFLGNTTTGLRNLNGSIIGSVTFPGATLTEQRAIADFLDGETARIDALVIKKRRMIDLLEERRAATMLAAAGGRFIYSGSLVPSSLPWLDQRPPHWREVLIRLVARTGSGHTPSRDHPEWWQDCTIPWITTGEVAQVRSDEREVISETREMISEDGLANSAAALHPPGTVVLCRTASAGYSGIMGTAMATSQDFATWTCGPDLRPRFLLLCLRAMRPDLLERLAMGSTHKTIYMPDIHALRIPLPPLEEQDRTVDRLWQQLGPIFGIRSTLRQQIALLEEHRQALITAAVTGELEIPGVVV